MKGNRGNPWWPQAAAALALIACTSAPERKPKPTAQPSPRAARCDAKAESATLQARLAERPAYGSRLTELSGVGLDIETSSTRANLVEWQGPAPAADVDWIIRITPSGWIVLPTEVQAGQPRETAISRSPHASPYASGRDLLSQLPEQLAGRVALAPDNDAPRWQVDLALAALQSRGIRETMLLFRSASPVPDSTRVPRGLGPDEGAAALDRLFADHRAICPEAHATLAGGVNAASIAALAKAVAQCPCETDFALMESIVLVAQGPLPLSAQVVQMAPSKPSDTGDAAGEGPDLELADEEWQLRILPWSEDFADLVRQAQAGPVRVSMPPLPPPPPPPPPRADGKRRR